MIAVLKSCTKHVTAVLGATALAAALAQVQAQDQRAHAQRRDTAMAQHPAMQPGVLGIPESRAGSGTAWQPDATPMYAIHTMRGEWTLMFHNNGYLQYINAGSDRADDLFLGDRDQFGSINWFMGMAGRAFANGELTFRAMLSLEPVTVGRCGFPDLLATGEFCHGRPLHDRQHPHDVFMEIAAEYQRAITRNVAISLYGGPSAEPALGPVAFPHRVSALGDPLAPISHHWQDATHIAFGVITAGVFGKKWKLEGSLFNGREPDEDRYNFDVDALDSYSGRIWFVPTDRLAMQVSIGRLNEVEPAHDGGGPQDATRATASLAYDREYGREGNWANTLVWGHNREPGPNTHSVLLESSLALDQRNLFAGRAELVGKTGEDLALEDPRLDDDVFTVGKATLNYTRQVPVGSFLAGLGAGIAFSFLPDELEPFYGSRTPVGFTVFASLRPRPMRMEEHAMSALPAPGDHQRQAPHDTMPMHPDTMRMHRDTMMHRDTTMHRDHQARMPGMPTAGARMLTLADVETALAAEQVHVMRMDTIRQPFWSVPTIEYQIHGARSRNAAVQVNVYPTHDAAAADARRIHPGGMVGTSRPTWAVPPHFFLAGNALITVLVDPAIDGAVMNAAHRAIERLGGRQVESAGGAPHRD